MPYVQRSKLGVPKGVKGYSTWAQDTKPRLHNDGSVILVHWYAYMLFRSEVNFAACGMTLC